MVSRIFWWVAASLAVVLGIVLFASPLDMWINGIIFVAYGLTMGLSFKFLHSKGSTRKN